MPLPSRQLLCWKQFVILMIFILNLIAHTFLPGDQFAGSAPAASPYSGQGHTGYFSKTLVYPYLEEHPDEALRWVQNYMMRKFRGKHDNDDQLGISPHRMRFVRYYGKFYPIGFCGVNIQ